MDGDETSCRISVSSGSVMNLPGSRRPSAMRSASPPVPLITTMGHPSRTVASTPSSRGERNIPFELPKILEPYSRHSA